MDLKTGKLLWTTEFPPELGKWDPNLGGGRAPQPHEVAAFANGIARVDLNTGKILWYRADIRENLGERFTYKDGIFAASFSDPPKAMRIDLETGETRWSSDNLFIKNDFYPNVVPGSNGTRFIGGHSAFNKNSLGHWFLKDSSVLRIDEQGHQLFESSEIEPLKDAFAQLGITWPSRFYSKEFAEHVLDMRKAFEQGDSRLFSRPLTVLMLPAFAIQVPTMQLSLGSG